MWSKVMLYRLVIEATTLLQLNEVMHKKINIDE